MTFLLRGHLSGPIGADVDALSRLPPFEEEEEQEVNNNAQTEQFPSPYAAAVVALQPINQCEVADPASRVAARVEAVELLLANLARDAVVHALGAHGHVGPRVHLLDLVVELLGPDAAAAHRCDGLARRGYEVVLLRLGERGHVGGEDLGDAADLGADHVEAAAGGLDDHGAECFREGGVEVDVSADHHVADVLVADGPQHFYVILENVGLNHLLQVNSLGTGTGDDEARVGVVFQDAGDDGSQQVSALVVEQTRYHNNGDYVRGAQAVRRRVWSEDARAIGRFLVVARPEILGDDCIGDY